ncbi:reverse transcriptase domain-containing protein [Tanacetum coccineum]
MLFVEQFSTILSVDEFDLEEMDLKWQVAMIFMRLKKFYKKTGRRLQSKGNQESRRRDAWNTGYRAKDNGRRLGKQEEPKALVTLDGERVDWTGHAEDEQENFALKAYSNSGSDTEREQLDDASIEIKAYTLALAKVEAQLVCHQKNQLAYKEKIRFMKINLDDKTDVLTYHKKLLAEAVKEKDELKTKLENFQSSSKGLRNSTQDDGSQSSGGGIRRPMQPARVCSYPDFMKCQPLNFKETEGVVGLSQWLEKILHKMESVFHISGCAIENQVKFATCTLLGVALTWWNGHVRTLGHDAAYAMTWGTFKKKWTDKYCPNGEIKKLEIELWNLKVRGNDVAAYTQRFQELALICTKFLADETAKIDKYIGGLPDNIH